MIPSRKRAIRRAYFASPWVQNAGYSPGMYTREERIRIAKWRAKRDAARAMRRRQAMRVGR